jgi:hypothetical protein
MEKSKGKGPYEFHEERPGPISNGLGSQQATILPRFAAVRAADGSHLQKIRILICECESFAFAMARSKMRMRMILICG